MLNTDIMKYILENYNSEKIKLYNEIKETNKNLKVLRKELKCKNLLENVNSFYSKNKSIFLSIDILKASQAINLYNYKLIYAYLIYVQKIIKLKKQIPFSYELLQYYNKLNEFEKKYLKYLISSMDNLAELLKNSKNIKLDIQKCNEYEILKNDLVKIVFKNIKKNN